MPNLLAILLFPIFPFLSFLIACTNLKGRANGVVFVLFYALFGFCHTFRDIRSDAFRKAEDLKPELEEAQQFREMVEEILEFRYKDIYNP